MFGYSPLQYQVNLGSISPIISKLASDLMLPQAKNGLSAEQLIQRRLASPVVSYRVPRAWGQQKASDHSATFGSAIHFLIWHSVFWAKGSRE